VLTANRQLFSAVALLLILGGCSDSTTESTKDRRLSDQELVALNKTDVDNEVIHFGFDLRTSPQEDARQYQSFLRYLERTTGYRFRLAFTPKSKNIATILGTGKVKFAAIGAVSYIKAQKQHDSIALVRGVNPIGNTTYRSFIVVRPDSPIKKIQDLRGKIFAFGSESSTQGHLIPRILLHKHGITLNDLADHSFNGSHQKCANAVVTLRAAACGMQDTLAEQLAKRGIVRILHRSKYYPSSGIAVNRDVPKEVIDRVRAALLAFDPAGKDGQSLYHWERTEMPQGFKAAHVQDYHELEKWIQKLGLDTGN